MASTNAVKIKQVGERATEFATLCGNVTDIFVYCKTCPCGHLY